MGEIYTSATQVITYLGPEQAGGAEAIALMMRIDAHFEQQYLRCLETNLQFRRGISELQKLSSFMGVKDRPSDTASHTGTPYPLGSVTPSRVGQQRSTGC
jgi:hypothetical protein